MTAAEELVSAVDAAFEQTARGLPGWPDPYPDRSPPDEAYSRLTNPHRWRILAARAEAWFVALADAGLAEIEEEVEVAWQEPPGTIVTSTDRAQPRAPSALPLIVAKNRMVDVDIPDAGIALGVGNPPVVLLVTPDCGCDACDSGSQDALDELDEYVLSVVTGSYRRLSRGEREITVISEGHRGSRGFGGRRRSLGDLMMSLSVRLRLGRFQGVVAPTSDYYVKSPGNILTRVPKMGVGVRFPWHRRRRRGEIDKILAHPKGWNEVSGASWFAED